MISSSFANKPSKRDNFKLCRCDKLWNITYPKVYDSCVACYEQKIKCSGESPCGRCMKFGLKCSYVGTRGSRSRRSKHDLLVPNRMDGISSRLDSLADPKMN